MNWLFVCTGNRFRSKAAEIIASAMVSKLGLSIAVDSCGVGGKSCFGVLTPKVVRVALEARGYSVPTQRSKKVITKLVRWADCVFYMQPSHLRALVATWPDSRSKFRFLGSKLSSKHWRIPDPAFDTKNLLEPVLDLIEKCLKREIYDYQHSRW